MNHIYRIEYDNAQLPDSPGEKARYGREQATAMAGSADPGIIALMQPHNHQLSCRLTIAVPSRLPEAIAALEAHGIPLITWRTNVRGKRNGKCIFPDASRSKSSDSPSTPAP